MKVFQHTRNERNLFFKPDRPDVKERHLNTAVYMWAVLSQRQKTSLNFIVLSQCTLMQSQPPSGCDCLGLVHTSDITHNGRSRKCKRPVLMCYYQCEWHSGKHNAINDKGPYVVMSMSLLCVVWARLYKRATTGPNFEYLHQTVSDNMYEPIVFQWTVKATIISVLNIVSYCSFDANQNFVQSTCMSTKCDIIEVLMLG